MGRVEVEIPALLAAARQMRAQVEPLAGGIEAVPTGVDTGNGACDAAVRSALAALIDAAGGLGQSLASEALGLTAVAGAYQTVDATNGDAFDKLVQGMFG